MGVAYRVMSWTEGYSIYTRIGICLGSLVGHLYSHRSVNTRFHTSRDTKTDVSNKLSVVGLLLRAAGKLEATYE